MKDTATPECHTNRDEDNTYFATVLKNINSSSSVFKLQEIRQTKLHELLALLPSLHNPVTLTELGKHLRAAINMVKAIENHSYITIKEVRKIAPNKNNDKQLRYYSTKKKAIHQTNGEAYTRRI